MIPKFFYMSAYFVALLHSLEPPSSKVSLNNSQGSRQYLGLGDGKSKVNGALRGKI